MTVVSQQEITHYTESRQQSLEGRRNWPWCLKAATSLGNQADSTQHFHTHKTISSTILTSRLGLGSHFSGRFYHTKRFTASLPLLTLHFVEKLSFTVAGGKIHTLDGIPSGSCFCFLLWIMQQAQNSCTLYSWLLLISVDSYAYYQSSAQSLLIYY